MDSIGKLKNGYRTFRDSGFRDNRAKFEQLVDEGQHPRVCIIACSDSRVDPAMLLQTDPGDLFVVRNVANLVPPCEQGGSYHGTSAALEFAVEHLEVEHVIVLGHAHCGGILSLFGDEEADERGRFIAPWMSIARSAMLRVEATLPDAEPAEKARHCERSAVLVSLENLMTFPQIRERVADGRLRLHGWYIDIRSCELSVYDSTSLRFEKVD